MKLGFVSAILPDLSLGDVVAFASDSGFDSVELMCWPKDKAERRYAGVTHIDVADFDAEDATKVKGLIAEAGVEISGFRRSCCLHRPHKTGNQSRCTTRRRCRQYVYRARLDQVDR